MNFGLKNLLASGSTLARAYTTGRNTLLAVLLFMAPNISLADEDRFIDSLLRSAFYHELGHALIDLQDIALFGQEEDAADTLSSVLIQHIHGDTNVLDVMRDVALGYYADVIAMETDGGTVDFGAVHGPDMQRLGNHLCQLTGADVDGRVELALDLGLDRDRLPACVEEFENADYSWGRIIRALERSGDDGKLVLHGFTKHRRGEMGQFTTAIVKEFNDRFSFPADIIVRVEPCAQPNAFYSSGKRMIIMCTEYVQGMRDNYHRVKDEY